MSALRLWNWDMNRDFDRLFDQLVGERMGSQNHWAFQPASEIDETDTHFLLSFDLPGVARKDIQIEVRDEKLIVSGERVRASDAKRASERAYGKFERVFALPSDVDAEKIEASHEDGVLSIAIPKAESAKPRQIPVHEGKGSLFGRWLKDKSETKSAERVA